MNPNFKVIKQIENKGLGVSLVQTVNDTYHVVYGSEVTSFQVSEIFKDFGLASAVFEMKYNEFNQGMN